MFNHEVSYRNICKEQSDRRNMADILYGQLSESRSKTGLMSPKNVKKVNKIKKDIKRRRGIRNVKPRSITEDDELDSLAFI